MTDIRDYLDVLIRRGWFVLAMPVLAMVAAFGMTVLTKPTYEATAIIVLSPATVSVPITGQVPPYYLTVDSPRRLPTMFTPTYYVALLKSDTVASQVGSELPVSVAVNASDKSLFEITVRGNDAARAASIANKYAQAGMQSIQQVLVPSGAEVAAAQRDLDVAENAIFKFAQDNKLEYDFVELRGHSSLNADQQFQLNQLLRDRDVAEQVLRDFARDLASSRILATGVYSPTMIAASVPTVPVSPKLTQNILIAAILGLALGVLGAFALEFFKRR